MKYDITPTQRTLRTLILDHETRTTVAARSSIHTGEKQPEVSYAQRYRGTEFDAATDLPVSSPVISRARSKLLIASSIALAVLGVILATPSV